MRWLVPFALAAAWPCAPAMADVPPLIVESGAGRIALSLFDIADIALSESGGVTDIFVTLMPGAADRLGPLQVTEGERLAAMICGLRFDSAPMRLPLTGHLYLVQTTMVRGWALQGLWQGVETCQTLSPAVFAE